MPTPGLTKQEQDFLDREIRRGKRWGKLTFAEVMDTLDRQHDALVAIRDDDAGDQAYGFKDVGMAFDRVQRIARDALAGK